MSAIWPFAQGGGSSVPQTINYDLIINEEFPGISFEATVDGGSYGEIRLVYGCMWFVTNALWNPNTLQWEQDTPANPSLGAYALVQCLDTGTLTWKIAAATGSISTAVTWVDVWQLGPQGTMTIEPLTLTAQSEVAEKVNATWNAGTSAEMIAREVNITDTTSASNSRLDQLSVNGVVEWAVDKTGLLVVGRVPPSAIVGGVITAVLGTAGIVTVDTVSDVATVNLAHGDYVDLANAQSISGIKTFTGQTYFGTNSGSEGGALADSTGLYISYGAEKISGSTWQAEADQAAIIFINSDGSLEIGSDAMLTPGNTYTPTPRFTFTVDGVFEGFISTAQLISEFETTGGISIYGDGTGKHLIFDTTALIETIESTDGSVTVTTPSAQTVNLQVNTSSISTFPQKGTGTINISTSGSGDPATVTIPTPYASDTAYIALVQLQAVGGGPFQATVSTYVLQQSGSEFLVYAEGDATMAQSVTFNWVTFPI